MRDRRSHPNFLALMPRTRSVEPKGLHPAVGAGLATAPLERGEVGTPFSGVRGTLILPAELQSRHHCGDPRTGCPTAQLRVCSAARTGAAERWQHPQPVEPSGPSICRWELLTGPPEDRPDPGTASPGALKLLTLFRESPRCSSLLRVTAPARSSFRAPGTPTLGALSSPLRQFMSILCCRMKANFQGLYMKPGLSRRRLRRFKGSSMPAGGRAVVGLWPTPWPGSPPCPVQEASLPSSRHFSLQSRLSSAKTRQ